VIASVAPLVVAGVIWQVTGSAFALVFAVLGPVIAVAGLVDGRRMTRGRRRREAADYSEALCAVRAAVAERHELLRRDAWQRTPSASGILSARHDAGRWSPSPAPQVALGTGSSASGLRLDGAADPAEQRELRDWAATLTGMPIAADPRGGIGIIGPLVLARAVARGLLVQLCFALPPGRAGLQPAPPGWEWTAALPHSDCPGAAQRIVVSEAGRMPEAGPDAAWIVIAVAETADGLPAGCESVVRVHGPGRAEIVRSVAHAWGSEFRPEPIAIEQALVFAFMLREQAAARGLAGLRSTLPDTVALADLAGRRPGGEAGPARGLDCVIGVGDQGDVSLDLVGSGPHAVVGGTTGSGKSELLVTWVTAMAARYPPGEVTFLLVDFKGGAAFGPLRALPHCVGLITDLDSREAARALRSLAAEVRHRERTLRDAGARDLGEVRPAGTLPRLVIVVDEFAAMLGAFPELHALFVDIAARGRSLGVHLILCTQRPAGVVRDALLANCSLRLSLRVNNRADSESVIGTDAAAALPPDRPGRCLVGTPSGGTLLCQIATTRESDVRAIVAATPAGPSPRRPWLDPLPAIVTESDLRLVEGSVGPRAGTRRGYRLGLLDEPDRQRRRVAGYDPARDGSLLVVGCARSGKSSLLAALATQQSDGSPRIELVAADLELTWDALERAGHPVDPAPDGRVAPRLLLLDDFDSICARWEPDHRLAALDLLTGALRDGPAHGLYLVVAVQRLTGALQALPALCGSSLLLRLPNQEEHRAAGGAAWLFDDALPPGGGSWQGERIQLLRAEPAGTGPAGPGPVAGSAPGLDFAPHQTLLVVSATPARSAARLRSVFGQGLAVVDIAGAAAHGGDGRLGVAETGGTVFVGDADSWQTQWGLLGALRAQASIVFDGCSLGDYRMISRRRDLPPPLAPGRDHVWVLPPEGAVRRASLGPVPPA
jgi:S-DNA-T family DNA segregation ATPase FtsK/SpoIIIE